MSNFDYRNWQLEDATDSRLEYISILLSRSNSEDDITLLRGLQSGMRDVLNKRHAALIKEEKKRV